MLNKIIFDKRNLRRAKTLVHPRASIKTTTYGTNNFVLVSALADTSAQWNLWGWKNFQDAGFGKNDLIPVSVTIQAANKILVYILGALKATVSRMTPKNEIVSCNSIIYVSDSVTGFFSRMKQWLNF